MLLTIVLDATHRPLPECRRTVVGMADATAGVLDMITGAGIYTAAFNWLEPIILGIGNVGKATVPKLLGVPAAGVIVALSAAMAMLLVFVGRIAGHPAAESGTGHGILGRGWRGRRN